MKKIIVAAIASLILSGCFCIGRCEAATVYWLVAWKQFGCDANCPPAWGGNYLNLQTNDGVVIHPDSNTIQLPQGNCAIKVVAKEQRFDDEKELVKFIDALNLKPLTELMLDQPDSLKWGFIKKKITITEKEL